MLPPLPSPTNPAVTTSATAAASLPALTKPRLVIECFNPADFAAPAPCDSLERETILKIRADDAVPPGTALRFVRRGDLRAEVELAQLARGKSSQFALPSEVCRGVVESKVEIQVVRHAKASDAGQVVAFDGPYFFAASMRARLVAQPHAVDAPYGKIEQLEAGIARVLAHNPSAFTYYGTQTYLVGERGSRGRSIPALTCPNISMR